jgi:hypothetical protein
VDERRAVQPEQELTAGVLEGGRRVIKGNLINGFVSQETKARKLLTRFACRRVGVGFVLHLLTTARFDDFFVP